MPCTMLAIIIWQFTVYPFQFDSPQVKRDLISSIINFLHELQNALIDFRKLGSNRKILKLGGEQTNVLSPLQESIFGTSGQNLDKS